MFLLQLLIEYLLICSEIKLGYGISMEKFYIVLKLIRLISFNLYLAHPTARHGSYGTKIV